MDINEHIPYNGYCDHYNLKNLHGWLVFSHYGTLHDFTNKNIMWVCVRWNVPCVFFVFTLKMTCFLQAFFQEECQSLDKKRHVLRLLQQRKITDVSSLKELPLPDQIPMQLVIGTKVEVQPPMFYCTSLPTHTLAKNFRHSSSKLCIPMSVISCWF